MCPDSNAVMLDFEVRVLVLIENGQRFVAPLTALVSILRSKCIIVNMCIVCVCVCVCVYVCVHTPCKVESGLYSGKKIKIEKSV